MTRLQATLVLTLVTLAAVVFGQMAWGVLGPVASSFAAVVPSLLRSVPAWAWWTAFGVGMALRGALAPAWFGARCRGSSCRRSSSPSAA